MMRPLITLVVPVWGDDTLLLDLVRRLPAEAALFEWVVAAVAPSERLRDLAQREAIRLVVCEKPSRGAQMNAGAAQARGSLLCFHHADSELRPEHLAALADAARNERIVGGAFHRHLMDRHFWIKPWEKPMRRLALAVAPLFGDQSIFVKTDVFQRMGGYANIPLMEDVEFSRRLRRMGRIALLEPPLWSSPRRFRRMGNLRASLTNAAFMLLFYLGVSPHTLHRWYYGRRRQTAAE